MKHETRIIDGAGNAEFDTMHDGMFGVTAKLEEMVDLKTDEFLDLNEEQMKGLSQDELEVVTKLYEVDIQAKTREVQSLVDYMADILIKATAVMGNLDIAKLSAAVSTYSQTHAKEEGAPKPKAEAGKVEAAQISNTINSNDNLMSPIRWGDLIDTVNANEPTVDEAAVQKVFRELLNARANDARTSLRGQMRRVIELASHE
jgi:hypothetical protein